MGTSTGYDMPKGGEWTPLKNDATQFVKATGQGSVSPDRLLRHYLRVNGGARSLSRGGGTSAGAGGGGRGGGAARQVGRSLGGFLSNVGRVGLTGALEEAGLAELIGKPAEEVTSGLLDTLASPGSTLDEHAARLALVKLNDELFEDTQTYEDVERVLSESLDQQGLFHMLARFFGHYLYERFCRDFYETWVKKVGSTQAAQALRSIKDCIETNLRAKLTGRDIMAINWSGREGLQLTEQVMQDTLEIFEVAT